MRRNTRSWGATFLELVVVVGEVAVAGVLTISQELHDSYLAGGCWPSGILVRDS